MRINLPHAIVFLLISSKLMADEADPVPQYALKNRSVIQAAARSPFLPVGYVPREKDKPVKYDASDFKLTAVFLGVGSPSLAIINGHCYQEGQALKLGKGAHALGPRSARLRLVHVEDGAVTVSNGEITLKIVQTHSGVSLHDDVTQAIGDDESDD